MKDDGGKVIVSGLAKFKMIAPDVRSELTGTRRYIRQNEP